MNLVVRLLFMSSIAVKMLLVSLENISKILDFVLLISNDLMGVKLGNGEVFTREQLKDEISRFQEKVFRR